MKSILFLVALIYFAEVAGSFNKDYILFRIFIHFYFEFDFHFTIFSFNSDSCCCSLHWGKWNCYCNIFNCNCKTVYPGYCQYTPGMSVFDDCQTDTTGKLPYEICGHWQNATVLETSSLNCLSDVYF